MLDRRGRTANDVVTRLVKANDRAEVRFPGLGDEGRNREVPDRGDVGQI